MRMYLLLISIFLILDLAINNYKLLIFNFGLLKLHVFRLLLLFGFSTIIICRSAKTKTDACPMHPGIPPSLEALLVGQCSFAAGRLLIHSDHVAAAKKSVYIKLLRLALSLCMPATTPMLEPGR